jgi:hypothetical protein
MPDIDYRIEKALISEALFLRITSFVIYPQKSTFS